MTDSPAQTGGMVALLPDRPTAKRLAARGGAPADKLHLTLAYLGDDVTGWTADQRSGLVDGIRGIAADASPVKGRVLGHTVFNADGGPDGDTDPCTVYLIGDAQGLDGLLKQVRAEVSGAKAGVPAQREPFVAHITAGEGLDPAKLPGSGPVRFDRLVVALAGDWNVIPLKAGAVGMSNAVRTPLATTKALALAQRLWKKEIIKRGPIAYRGGKFDVTDDYLDQVVAAFHDKAITSVPFVFVDDTGAHSEAPERTRGKVIGLERTDRGIDAILSLSDEAEKIVTDNPEFGVSVLIKHDRTTGDGANYPAVLAHVAGTHDPVLRDLAPFQPVDDLAASNEPDDVLDLLALTAPSGPPATPDGVDPNPKEKAAVPLTLTDEQAAALQALLPVLTGQAGINKPIIPATPPAEAATVQAATVQPADPQPADQPFTEGNPEPNTDAPAQPAEPSSPDGDPVHREENPNTTENAEAEFTDAELDEMVRALADDLDEPVEEPVLVAASNSDGPDALQLSHDLRAERQARERLELRLAQVERERDDRAYAIERDRMARELGVSPRLTDIIAPLLRGSGQQIALSNGQQANAGELVRRFVRELHATGFLDLSLSQGTALDVDVDKAADEDAARQAAAAEYIRAIAH